MSEEVEQYSPLISKYAMEYGISEYTQLIKAVMMQESGGRGSDPHAGFRVRIQYEVSS